jgi:hypothetical protein
MIHTMEAPGWSDAIQTIMGTFVDFRFAGGVDNTIVFMNTHCFFSALETHFGAGAIPHRSLSIIAIEGFEFMVHPFGAGAHLALVALFWGLLVF